MKKILWLIILLGTLYIISIFLAPVYANKIGNLLGINSFNEKIKNIFGGINDLSTNVPDSEEIKKSYNDAVEKAGEFKTNIVDGIDTTKTTIEDIRITLSGAEDTYNNIKDSIEKTADTVDKLKENFSNIDKMGNIIKGSVNTDIVQ